MPRDCRQRYCAKPRLTLPAVSEHPASRSLTSTKYDFYHVPAPRQNATPPLYDNFYKRRHRLHPPFLKNIIFTFEKTSPAAPPIAARTNVGLSLRVITKKSGAKPNALHRLLIAIA
ncbi:hypothetical protein KCP73_04690 [Salmonella enterica subsp. enterica]|nr:hypothetical protein KCP73_04690 [Salmonella enterica subsp. enterica]